jgi:hypothetical protein
VGPRAPASQHWTRVLMMRMMMMIYDDAMPAKLIYYPLLGDIICVLLSAFHVEQKAFENHPIS